MNETENQISEVYQKDIAKAIRILRQSGCKEIFLIGSVGHRQMGESSDIDLAIRGCPRGEFFHILGKLLMELEHRVDLVNLDSENSFSKFLEREGELVRIA